MKTLFIFAATVALISCSSPQPEQLIIPSAKVQSNAEVSANADASLFISGMTCEMGCKGAIESKLGNSEGVVNFNINFHDSTALVVYDSTLVSLNEIMVRVSEVGNGDFYQAFVSK